jgi:hypothetical protein
LASSEESAILKVGISGHQKREGADWVWVEQELMRVLAGSAPLLEGWTSLATGADQVFARAILYCRGSLVAVVPIIGYERFFEQGEDLLEYHRLRAASRRVIQLDNPEPNYAFLAAGRHIVDECASLIAIWDGALSKGLGGTADVVAYAQSLGRAILVLDPIRRSSKGSIA